MISEASTLHYLVTNSLSVSRIDVTFFALPVRHSNVRSRKYTRVLQVTALVFYGRKRFMSILNYYLERNLASQGGILQSVCSLPKW